MYEIAEGGEVRDIRHLITQQILDLKKKGQFGNLIDVLDVQQEQLVKMIKNRPERSIWSLRYKFR